MKEIYFLNVFVCVCLFFVLGSNEQVLLEQMCADPECSEPISHARTDVKYAAKDSQTISFNKGELLTILRKPPPGSVKGAHWYAKKNSNEGYEIEGFVPPGLIKEFKIMRNTKDLISVIIKNGKVENNVDLSEISEKETSAGRRDGATSYFAGGVAAEMGDRGPPSTPIVGVVEGTTLFMGTDGETSILVTSTQEPTFQTQVPSTSPVPPVASDQPKPVNNEAPMSDPTPSNISIEEEEVEEEADVEEDDDNEDEDEDGDGDGDGEIPIESAETASFTSGKMEEDASTEVNHSSMSSEVSSDKLVTTTMSATSQFVANSENLLDPVQITSPDSKADKIQVNSGAPNGASDQVIKTIPHLASGNPESLPVSVIKSTESVREINETNHEMEISMLNEASLKDAVEVHAGIQNTQSESSQFLTMLDTALNSEPGKSAEIDDEILRMYSSQVPAYSKSPEIVTENTLISNLVENTPATETPDISGQSAEPASILEPVSGESLKLKFQPDTTINLQENDATYQNEFSASSSGTLKEIADNPHNMVDGAQMESATAISNGDQSIPHDNEISSIPPTTGPPLSTSNENPSYAQLKLGPPIYPGLFPKDLENLLGATSIQKNPQTSEMNTPQSELLEQTVDTGDRSEQFGNTVIPTVEPLNLSYLSDIASTEDIPPKEKIPLSSGDEVNGGIEKKQILNNNAVSSDEISSPLVGKKMDDSLSTLGTVEEVKLHSPAYKHKNDQEEDPPGMFSGVFNFFSGLLGSSEKPVDDSVKDDTTPSVKLPPPSPLEGPDSKGDSAAVPDGACKTPWGLETDCADAPSPPHLIEFFDKGVPGTSYTFLYLVTTAVTVLIFTLGYYFIERTRQESLLIAKVNKLTHELQVATSQAEAKDVQELVTVTETSSEVLTTLQAEVYSLKMSKEELESQLESLQQELETATEAGMEMNRMISELLTQRNGSDSLLKSVEQLQGQLNAQQRVIDELSRSLLEKGEENQSLQAELAATQDKAGSLEEELNDMRQNLNQLLKEKETLTWELESRNAKLEADLVALTENNAKQVATLSQSVAELTEKLELRETDFYALGETIEAFSRRNSDFDKKAFYDVGSLKAELSRTKAEKESLQEKLSEEEGARKLLEDHVKSVDEEVAHLRSSYESAEKEKVEAETRLAVLSNYFKEKETQLQRELGLQEAMWVQKQGDETSIHDRMKLLQEEVDNYKNSNEEISVTNSLCLLCTDSVHSVNMPSVSIWSLPMQIPPSPVNSPNLKSLPNIPVPKSSKLYKKSSEVFEARLERMKLMTSLDITSANRPIPEDLLKLEELMAVQATTFQQGWLSPTPCGTTNISHIGETSIKCSELIHKFENFQKPESILTILNDNKKEKSELLTKLSNDKSLPEVITQEEKDFFETVSEKELLYDCDGILNESPQLLPAFLPLPPDPTQTSVPASSSFPAEKSKVQSAENSTYKECDLNSSAALESDNVNNVKNGAQNDLLKKEIIDQERGLKGQIATLEKKAHENWVAARQAERRLEESKQEAGQLRNMLTLMEKSAVSEVDNKPTSRHPGELNGEDSLPPILPDGTSPLPLPPLPLDPLAAPPPLLPPGFMPPPFMPSPGGFIPPPPFLPGDRRPPPLGRMSSPPLNRFSPAPGDYVYERMTPPPLSPPVRSYRSPPSRRSPSSPWDEPPPRSSFRPVATQRDSRREYQGSNLSSGHSSSESLEKPPRRRGGKI